MIIYNVTLKVDAASADEWVSWMLGEHIPDLLRTGLFVQYRLSRLLEQEEADGVTYSVQYGCRDIEAYNKYIAEYADVMREKALAKFAGRFVAFRSVMEVVDQS